MYNGQNKTALSSRKALSEAFFYLLEQHSFEEITVSDICKQASISRQTFYTLYKKKENILINEMKTNYPFTVCHQDLTLLDLCHYFSIYLEKNAKFLSILLGNGYSDIIYNTFYEPLVSCHCSMRDNAAIRDEYFASFMAGGLLSITKEYILKEKGDREFVQQITYDLFSGKFFK